MTLPAPSVTTPPSAPVPSTASTVPVTVFPALMMAAPFETVHAVVGAPALARSTALGRTPMMTFPWRARLVSSTHMIWRLEPTEGWLTYSAFVNEPVETLTTSAGVMTTRSVFEKPRPPLSTRTLNRLELASYMVRTSSGENEYAFPLGPDEV